MSTFWSIWVAVIVLGTIFGCWWLLVATRKHQTSDKETERTTGHSFDGIEEYDNPLPKWWYYLFVGSCVFSLGYLALYPGLGNFQGLLGWSSQGQWESEMQQADARYSELYERYAGIDIPELAKNDDAMKMGQRLFSNNCAVCHGSAGRGSIGFPNLTDDAWLYGGEPDDILRTLHDGRNGNMPAYGTASSMTTREVDQVVNFVLSLTDRAEDEKAAEQGEAVYQAACAACHGGDGTGNQALGAPNLTDDAWLYGSTYEWIEEAVKYGRQNNMPAQSDRLSDDQIHILAAYVYSLSN